MPRRKKSSAGGSLDSLLDTMTNVVGILVILLTVTQLGVRDAVKRIGEGEQVDPQLLEEALAKADKLQAEREALEASLAALSANPADQQAALGKVRREIRSQQAALDQISQLMNSERAAKLAANKEAQAANKAQVQEHLKKMNQLKAQFDANAAKIQSMRAKLADTPGPVKVPPKIVNLPNPRAAPAGAEPITFICREGKIYFLDIPLHQNRAVKWTDNEVARRRLNRDPKKGIDCKPLFASFNRLDFRDKWVEASLELRGRWPYLVLARREHGGETIDEIQQATSDYQKGLAGVDPKKFYLQFLVWNDSFELYLKARQVAAQKNLLAGWKPMTSPEEYKVRLASKLRHGPPPPPPKNPPPKPNPPAQPPKPRPEDVID